jgi:hypothetical protein
LGKIWIFHLGVKQEMLRNYPWFWLWNNFWEDASPYEDTNRGGVDRVNNR